MTLCHKMVVTLTENKDTMDRVMTFRTKQSARYAMYLRALAHLHVTRRIATNWLQYSDFCCISLSPKVHGEPFSRIAKDKREEEKAKKQAERLKNFQWGENMPP